MEVSKASMNKEAEEGERYTMNLRHTGYALTAVVLLGLACSKKEPPTSTSGSLAAVASSVPVAGAGASSTPVAGAVAPLSPPVSSSVSNTANAPPSEVVPESFSDGTKVPHAVATGLGCEATEKQGWLQLLCRKKNGAGGHPKRALLGEQERGQEFVPDEHGELRVNIPYRSGGSASGYVEWTDTKYNLNVQGTELKLEWAVGLEVRRSCANLEKESKALITKAQQLESPERLTELESAKFPVFGRCQPAGFGSWALGLRGISASGVGVSRALVFELDVVRVDAEGKVSRADFGTLTAQPSGLDFKPLQIYDYDDDGLVELIVPYDLKAIPAGVTPPRISPVWTTKTGKIEPYAQAEAQLGGAQTTQLEFDMRTDIGGYNPFIAYLSPDCGGVSCPPRLVGPVRYARAMADGSFSLKDPQAMAAINRACPKGLSVTTEKEPARLALAIACARLRGDEPTKVEAELAAKGTALCKGEASCGLLDALVGFAKVSLDQGGGAN